MFVEIVGVRTRAVRNAQNAPEQPARRGRRTGPRAMYEGGWSLAKLPVETAGKPGAEHVLPEVQPRGRSAHQNAFKEIEHDAWPANAIPWNDKKKQRNEIPEVELPHRQSLKFAAATPERVQPELESLGLQRGDIPLQKSLRGFRKRREQKGNSGLVRFQFCEGLTVPKLKIPSFMSLEMELVV